MGVFPRIGAATPHRPAPIGTAAMDPDTAIAIEQARATVLDLATQPHVHLAVWNRQLPPPLAPLRALDWTAIDDLDFEARIDDLDDTLAEELAQAGYCDDALGGALRDEIAMLARRFAGIFAIDAVTVRLEWVETDACRKFHVDYVTARLLCSMLGPGTQWVYGEHAENRWIRQMRTGDVGIFKGRLATDKPMVLHRSPPIAGTGDVRLLLAIDPPGAR